MQKKETTGLEVADDPIEKIKNTVLSTTDNTTVTDLYGNLITIPAGFKIKVDADTNNATTVDKGIVIIDSEENEFVWIPVPEDGKVYTDAVRTEANVKKVELNRYTFDENGDQKAQNDAVITEARFGLSYNYKELQTSSYGNETAKSITNFKQSVSDNKGYYIGRYEARTETTRTSTTNSTPPMTLKGTDKVYNYVNQMQAADLAQNMYDNTKPFISDLMNSYAWDTATLFLQRCGTNSKYSRQPSLNSSSATTGTNDTTKYTGTKDTQCNVYDMASNLREYTTETSERDSVPCVTRGRCYYYGSYVASQRHPTGTDEGSDGFCRGFRPILYMGS